MGNDKTTTLKDIGEDINILNDGVIENTDESNKDIFNSTPPPPPSPIITKAKSYVDSKKPLESKMPPAEKIEIYKRNDNGELELCDVEITREMLSSMSLQDIIRKFLIKRYGYGEYVPMTIKAGKDPIIGGSIKFAKPMDEEDIRQPISNNNDSVSGVISQMRDIFETVMNRTEQVRRESEEKYDRITNMIKQQQETISNLLFAKKEDEDTNKNKGNDLTALIGLIMQQNQANMNVMIEMMRNNNKPQESFNLSEALEKAMKPIVEKIDSIENKNSGLEDLTHTDDDKVKRLEEQISSLKEQLIANEKKELENKIDELNKKIMDLSSKPTSNNALGSIEEIINVYDRLKEFSSKMFAGNSNGSSSGKEEFMGFLSDIMEKLPNIIDSLKSVSANPNDASIEKAREQMGKLYKQNIELKKYIMKMKEQKKLPAKTKKPKAEPEEGTGKIVVGNTKEQAQQPEQTEQIPNVNNTNNTETNTSATAPEPKKRGRKKKVVNNIVENAIYSKFNNEQFINAVNTENYETALQYILSVIQSNMGVIDTYMSNSGIQTNSNQEKFIAIINFAKPIVEKIEGIDKNKLNNLFEVINKTTKEES